jgi:hypothetical protein
LEENTRRLKLEYLIKNLKQTPLKKIHFKFYLKFSYLNMLHNDEILNDELEENPKGISS